MTNATTKPLTRDELEDAAYDTRAAAQQLEKQMAFEREEMQALIQGDGEVDMLSFQKRRDANTTKLVQTRLAAARAELALLEHDAGVNTDELKEELAALDAAEAAQAAAERAVQEQRAKTARARSMGEGFVHRRAVLVEEVKAMQNALLQAVDGKVSTLKPPPKIYQPPRRVGDVKATPLTS